MESENAETLILKGEVLEPEDQRTNLQRCLSLQSFRDTLRGALPKGGEEGAMSDGPRGQRQEALSDTESLTREPVGHQGWLQM